MPTHTMEEMLQRLCITMETLVQHLETATQERDREANRREREYLDIRDILLEHGRIIAMVPIDFEKALASNTKNNQAQQTPLATTNSISLTSLNQIWTYAKWAVFPALGAITHFAMKFLEHSR